MWLAAMFLAAGFVASFSASADRYDFLSVNRGSGGVIAATEGKDIELPQGTIVRIRLDSPLELR